MNRKLPVLIILAGTFILLGLFLVFPASRVDAQCSTASTCQTCHEVQQMKPVNTLGDWHIEHAQMDACAVCHGGDRDAVTMETAHLNITTQLSDMPAKCLNCHSDSLEQKFNTYAALLGVTDTHNLQLAQQQGGINPNLKKILGVGPANVIPSPGDLPTIAQAPAANTTANTILGIILAVSVFGGGGYVLYNENRRKGTSGNRTAPLAWIGQRLSREHWSPYSAGILLGLVCILAVAVGQHLVGVAGGIARTTSTLFSAIAPNPAAQNEYFQFRIPAGITWEVTLLIGIFFGGMLAAISSRTFRLRWNGDPTWNKIFGPEKWKRLVIGFVGAIIIQIGASIAGGCTSGLAISGGMLLAPSAFLFIGGMFASGILITLLVYRRRY